jgi:hypothetical protein
MVTVVDRSAETLLPTIPNYILPDTTIISDGWAAYRKIGELPKGYTHMTVKHSETFVDSGNGATTNHVESEW